MATEAATSGDPRTIAWTLLQAVETRTGYANLILPTLIEQSGADSRDAALATELGYGTLRCLGTIDEIVRVCSSRGLDAIEIGVLNILRLGAYQLLRTRIPRHAAVATSVELARSTGYARSTGFVNAVLRKVSLCDFDQWCDRIGSQASELGRLALRYSHPGWIVAAFAEALGPERLAELEPALAADDSRPETHLVAWPGRQDRAELARQSGGEPGRYSPYAVRLSGGGAPHRLAAIAGRRAAVQDEGSQLCAIALAELPIDGSDLCWLDLCAGPGGKTALLAALGSDRGVRLTATELHPHRAGLVRGMVAGWDVDVQVRDAREATVQPDRHDGAALGSGFDRVLLDAPCTGLGALRRRPEARWRRTTDDLADLVVLQAQLLDAAVRAARPGGLVGYVTCSPHPAETTQQIRGVLARTPGLRLVDARAGFSGVPDLGAGPTVQLWPHRHGSDAMFFAALRTADGVPGAGP